MKSIFLLCSYLFCVHFSHQIGVLFYRAQFRFNWFGIPSYRSQVCFSLFIKQSEFSIEISIYLQWQFWYGRRSRGKGESVTTIAIGHLSSSNPLDFCPFSLTFMPYCVHAQLTSPFKKFKPSQLQYCFCVLWDHCTFLQLDWHLAYIGWPCFDATFPMWVDSQNDNLRHSITHRSSFPGSTKPKTLEIDWAMVICNLGLHINFVLLHMLIVDCCAGLFRQFETLPSSSGLGFGNTVAGDLHLVHNRFVIFAFFGERNWKKSIPSDWRRKS